MAKSISKILILLFVTLSLTGCCYFCKKDPVIHEVDLPVYSCPVPPPSTRPVILDVRFSQPLFEKAIIGLDEPNYKNLYINDANLLFYVNELEKIIKVYRDEEKYIGKSLKDVKALKEKEDKK